MFSYSNELSKGKWVCVLRRIEITRSTGTVHTSAKARLTSATIQYEQQIYVR